ncbi:MAG: HAD family hydrolase [Labilithrix sp.]|nr:HAD family hydrolase [Labilithrix sp.]MCW5810879.1 HAD family hydrolase [Labilithrix sp.]
MRVRAVLFDVDGTLLESNDAHAHAWVEALRGHGHDVPFEMVRSKIGMGGDKLLAEVARIDHESPQGKTVSRLRASILKAHYLADLGPFHGARMLVDLLRSRGLVCAAVSSSSAADIADLLRAAGVADLMDEVICADDADRSKPDADLVQVALERLGLEPDEAVMLGDTPYDVEAAHKAGVITIALRCGGYWSDQDLAGAVALYDDPADLAANLDRSPLALDRDSLPPPSPVRVRTRRIAESA